MTAAGRFPAAAGLAWHELPGGLSGARVWRGDDPVGGPRAALKRLPAGFPAERLRQVHGWMRAAGLPVVPAVFAADDGDTAVESGGHVWECLGWVPGGPVLVPGSQPEAPAREGSPSPALRAAIRCLADLHRRWAPLSQVVAPPPGVARRRELFAAVAPLLRTAPPHLTDAAAFLRHALPPAAAALAALDATGPVHPCLCDARPEHFLFAGDALAGVIDFGAMKPDHPAVDLARLLGETGHLDAGVAAYHAAGGSPAVTPELVRRLAETGHVGAVANWVLRLSGREPLAAEAARLARLLPPLVH